MTAFTVFIIILLLLVGPSLFVVIGKQREKSIPKRPSAALPVTEDETVLDRHWQTIKWLERKECAVPATFQSRCICGARRGGARGRA